MLSIVTNDSLSVPFKPFMDIYQYIIVVLYIATLEGIVPSPAFNVMVYIKLWGMSLCTQQHNKGQS